MDDATFDSGVASHTSRFAIVCLVLAPFAFPMLGGRLLESFVRAILARFGFGMPPVVALIAMYLPAAVVFAISIIAGRRIRLSRGSLRGMRCAVSAAVLTGVWLLLFAGLFILLLVDGVP